MLFLEVIQNRGEYYQKIGFPSLYHVLATILENGQKRGVFRPIGRPAYGYQCRGHLRILLLRGAASPTDLARRHRSRSVRR